jgi:hypothetical protein
LDRHGACDSAIDSTRPRHTTDGPRGSLRSAKLDRWSIRNGRCDSEATYSPESGVVEWARQSSRRQRRTCKLGLSATAKSDHIGDALPMPDIPSLPELLAVLAPGCGVAGAFIGLALKTSSDRQIAENIALGFALGVVVGTTLSFAIWVGAVAAGA